MVASQDHWTKSDTATSRHQEEKSRPKEVLKRQDQLGHAGKRKHFDASEWKKKRSNFTKCGKPNKQLSRYNQTVTVGIWFVHVFFAPGRESYSLAAEDCLAFILQTGVDDKAWRSQFSLHGPQPTQNLGATLQECFQYTACQSKTCSSGPTGHENLSNYQPGTADRPSLQVELLSSTEQRTA